MDALVDVPAAPIDLRALIPERATITWGDGAGEPRSLVRALIEQRHQLTRPRLYLGLHLSGAVRPEHRDALDVLTMGGLGGTATLTRTGAADVLPIHISTLVHAIERRDFPIDVAFAQVSPPNPAGHVSLGVVANYLVPALATASVRIAEINDQVPRTTGGPQYHLNDFDAVVRASYPLPRLPRPAPSPVADKLAATVAQLVPHRAVLQTGVGSVLDTVASALCEHRDLSIHSGLLTESLTDLIACGAVTNATKPIDTGISVATMVLGGPELYDYVDNNPAITVRSAAYTHDSATLSQLDTLTAINTALEVDLTGQVNAETANNHYIGAVGGLADFSRAAARSPSGRSIIVLPSTAINGRKSRIVHQLDPGAVTLARSDVDMIVTEHGVANLRTATLADRARQLVAIAHPRYRDHLSRRWAQQH